MATHRNGNRPEDDSSQRQFMPVRKRKDKEAGHRRQMHECKRDGQLAGSMQLKPVRQ